MLQVLSTGTSRNTIVKQMKAKGVQPDVLVRQAQAEAIAPVGRLLSGHQQTDPKRRVKAQEHRHDVTTPAKPPRVPQIVEQEIAPKGIKQAHQHQHYL